MAKISNGQFQKSAFDGNAAVDLRKFESEDVVVDNTTNLATGGQRTLALLIDAFFMGVINKLVVAVIVFFSHSGKPGGWVAVVTAVLQLYYFIFSEYNNGQTLGKKIMKIKVIDANGARDLTFKQVLYREIIGRSCSAFTFGFGYLGAWQRPDRATFHDRMAKTSVIKVNEL